MEAEDWITDNYEKNGIRGIKIYIYAYTGNKVNDFKWLPLYIPMDRLFSLTSEVSVNKGSRVYHSNIVLD